MDKIRDVNSIGREKLREEALRARADLIGFAHLAMVGTITQFGGEKYVQIDSGLSADLVPDMRVIRVTLRNPRTQQRMAVAVPYPRAAAIFDADFDFDSLEVPTEIFVQRVNDDGSNTRFRINTMGTFPFIASEDSGEMAETDFGSIGDIEDEKWRKAREEVGDLHEAAFLRKVYGDMVGMMLDEHMAGLDETA